MKILIDIGHPAHVHYCKNIIKILKKKGCSFLVIARNREVVFNLLQEENIEFTSRGKGSSNLFGKFIYMIYADLFILLKAIKFKPNILLSYGSPYAAHVSRIIRKPHIAIVDTEHPKLGNLSFFPFTETILTPSCYFKDLGTKQIRFKSYLELNYLHPNRFNPDQNVLKELDIKNGEKYVILRFVSWSASHDLGQTGLDYETKINLVENLQKHAKVFISSESELPEKLQSYKLKISPNRLHDALAFAALYVGEGATTASECAVLGTPNIYVNSLTVGYCKEQDEKYGLRFQFRKSEGVINQAIELVRNPTLKEEFKQRRKKMLSENIDVTKFMVWFIENYPNSIDIMKNTPDFQQQFI